MTDSDVEDIYTLSPLQEGMLFHAVYAPELNEYFEQISYTFHTFLDIVAFEKAWQAVVDQIPVLRTSFHWEELDKPVQVVHRNVVLPFHFEDWRTLPPNAQAGRMQVWLAQDRQRGFRLSEAPLVRVAVFRLNDNQYQFIVTFHHILIDGWSLNLVFREFAKAYEAFSRGVRPSVSKRRPYRDYISWLQQQDLRAAETYWRHTLKGYAGPTALFIEKNSTNGPSPQNGYHEQQLTIGPEASSLYAFARRHQITVNTLFQGAWAILLSRYTGSPDVVYGSVVSGRPPTLDDVEEMVGLFINTLPLRARVDSNRHVVAWLKQFQSDQLESRQYEYSPLVQVQGWSEVQRGKNLFETVVVFNNLPAVTSERSGITSRNDVLAVERLSHPLSIIIEPSSEILVRFLYSLDRFESTAVTRILGHLSRLLAGIVQASESRIRDLDIVLGSEWDVIRKINRTTAAYPRDISLHKLWKEQCERTPAHVVLIQKEKSITYLDLDRRANQIAHILPSNKHGRPPVVGLYLERSPDAIAAMLGILKIGAAFLPIDIALPSYRVRQILNDSKVPVVITNSALIGKLPDHIGRAVCIDGELPESAPWDSSGSTETGPAYVMYTSGSTGTPKAVVATHRATINRLAWMWETYPYSATDVACQKTALGFVDSIAEIFGPLLRGIPSVILSDDTVREPTRFVAELTHHRVTRVVLVPSLLRVLLDVIPGISERLSCTEYWFVSGEALPAELVDRFFDTLPQARLVNLYGSSEVAGDVTYQECSRNASKANISIGVPIANTEAYVLDDRLRPAPLEIPGDLYIGGDGLALGYLGHSHITAERFIPNPFSARPGSRLYKMGDVARFLPNGSLEYQGRLDHQVKVRGNRIELGEIETVLSSNPSVEVSTVVVHEKDHEKSLVAFIVPKDPMSQGEDEVSQVANWLLVWDETYQDSQPQQSTFNTAGWNSSYTALPISSEQMREWLGQTVSRILELKHDRVLEIGCGSGLLLFRLAAKCERYVGTDISPTALASIQRIIRQELPELSHVELLEREAASFDGFEVGTFDLVILNSVVQYFPSEEYLRSVLTQAVKILSPGGAVFVGDVRNLGLLEAFRASVEIARPGEQITNGELLHQVHRQAAEEEELVIDPLFFHKFAKDIDLVGHVETLWKRGSQPTEMTRYRYDAMIFASTHMEECISASVIWGRDVSTIEELINSLGGPSLLAVGIPNARVIADVQFLKDLQEADPATIIERRRAIQWRGAPAIDPEEICSAAAAHGYSALVRCDTDGRPETFSVLFYSGSAGLPITRSIDPAGINRFKSELINNPLRRSKNGDMPAKLRRYVGERLPAYMVPSAFVFLKELPLTPSGKVDRKALAQTQVARRSASVHVAPRNSVEETLVAIWTQMLNVPRVSVFDNFFELGGHSLLSMQLASRIRQEFSVEVSLRKLFESPTIDALAALIQSEISRGLLVDSQPIPRAQRDKYRVAQSGQR